ncbi:uncharacterized protein PGTG_15267 [Puccinia graminis f. sp. tritici CRL 75-36-700-3]|uniref:RRM domain-containing protein n=1 Tax=Puccinia graminis f. sp. tritici (strain CRL 75-36-700-3 / race SCCL) TaxID=418459 RepID=E3KYM9_PUCGT|nr:uncharacterized protein PGTG_15267 [Puccinia graminis f. sp. tritici CRL 75-36-700-3]EFP89425.2 hypothetical protein PGTG_15267 [Puccinia graminis f. sp. tritici CRL 75-36-700-3]
MNHPQKTSTHRPHHPAHHHHPYRSSHSRSTSNDGFRRHSNPSSHEPHLTKPSDHPEQFAFDQNKPKSPVSQSIILKGIPWSANESSVFEFLESMGAAVRFVKVIYDHQTHRSKRYAYAHFFGLDRAQEFLEPRFPFITWKEPENSEHRNYYNTLKIRIDYCTEPPEVKKNLGNGGDDDKSEIPNQILLLRGLDKKTTLQDIHTSLQMIRERIPIQNIMLVMDRATQMSCGYAMPLGPLP